MRKIIFLLFLICSPLCAGPVDLTTLSKRPLKGEAKLVSETFHQAAEKYHVPVEILFAVGWVESRWSMRDGQPSTDQAYGAMGLRSSNRCKTLDKSTVLTGHDPNLIKTDLATNVDAAAAVLADLAHQDNLTNSDLEAWAPVVDDYMALTDPQLKEAQVNNIFGTLMKGMGRSFSDRSILAIAPLKSISVEKAKSYMK